MNSSVNESVRDVIGAARPDVDGNRREYKGVIGSVRRSSATPKKTKDLKGHEALLRGLEASGATISIVLRDSESGIRGVVKHSDPYTVSVVDQSDGMQFVVFKHAMIGFKVETPAPIREVLES